MAGRQRHAIHVGHVPGANDQAPRVGIGADLLQQLRDLVDVASVGRRPAAPLVAVDRAEVAVRVRPLVPDRDAVGLEVRDVGVAAQEPEELVHDGLRVHLLRRQQRKPARQVEAHLVAEHRPVSYTHLTLPTSD